jgi:YD repeat-containing protein
MLTSLHVVDEPLSYTPPVGPPVSFHVTYNQREAYKPAVFSYSNLGPKWTFDWISYVSDTNQGGGQVKVYLRGGGQETYVQQSSTSIPGKMYNFYFNNDYMSHAQLMSSNTALVNGLINYQRLLPDGSKEIFAQVQNDPAHSLRRTYLSQIVDSAGNAIKLNYDSMFRVVSVADALGQVTTLSYELASDPLKVTKVTDPFGRSAVLTYNGQGQLASITDPVGITSQFTYIDTDFMSSLTTPYGTTTFRAGIAPGNDPLGGVNRSLEAVDPLGGAEHLEFRFYDPTQSNVYGSSLYWDKRAWASAPGDPASARLVNWALDSHLSIGLRHYEQPPLESQVHYSFADTKGKLTTDGTTSGEANFVGLPVKVVKTMDDGTSQTYQAQYNVWGNPKQVIDPLDRITLFDYDSTGVDLLEIHNGSDNNATLARFSYNSQHLPLTSTDAAGQTTTYTYNAQGRLLTVTDAKNQTTTLTYDGQGYLTRITGPLPGATAAFTHDQAGRVQTVTDSQGYQLAYKYDALDRLTQINYPDGTNEQITYSNLDPLRFQDRLGRVTQVAYDALRRPVTVTDPLGNVTSYTWCNCGDLMQVMDANGNTTSWERDLEGRITAKVYPDGSRVTYAYEKTSGRLAQVTDAAGQIITLQYAADNNLLSMSSANTAPQTFTYDPKYDRLIGVRDGIGTATYSYNPAGKLGGLQVAAVSGPLDNSTIAYTYDELGQRIGRTVNGSTTSWTYDPLSRVVSESNPLGKFSASYLGATANLTQIVYPYGQLANFRYFGANGDERLQEIKNLAFNQSVISQFDYAYAPSGEIQSWTRLLPLQTPSSSAWNFSYDAAAQLT